MQLLRSYDQAMTRMRPVEKKLLEYQITQLNCHMDKGQRNHNWFSLSIPEYIKECHLQIDGFKEQKVRVLQHASNIEKKVQNIEDSVLVRPIDFSKYEIMTLQDFSEYFDVHRERVLGELVKDYQNIGETYLRQIESTIFESDTLGCEKMHLYYQYWERRIFNAITKMVIRALAANKALWKGKPLIKMEASYVYPEMIYHPTVEELRTQLDKFNRNILESAKKFGRWWDGFCKVFEETIDKDTSEKTIRYTFYDDIVRNRVIAQLNMDIVTLTYQIQTKFTMQADGYFSKQVKIIYDKNQLIKMHKNIEKSNSVTNIETKILGLKQIRKIDIKRKTDSHQNALVLVDYSDVKRNAIEKCDEWLALLGKVLENIAKSALLKIVKKIKEYHEML